METVIRIIDSPIPWAVAGLLIGFFLGVTSLSVWLLALGFGVFIIYLQIHGPAEQRSEGRLFASGPVLMVFWVLGFVNKDLI